MSSDDEIMDPNLLSGDEDDQYVTGFDEDDEELDMNEEGSNLDEEAEGEEDEEFETAKPQLNGKSHSNKRQAKFDIDEDEDELVIKRFLFVSNYCIKDGEQAEGFEKEDENILEKLKNARITHQKFFDMLAGRIL